MFLKLIQQVPSHLQIKEEEIEFFSLRASLFWQFFKYA